MRQKFTSTGAALLVIAATVLTTAFLFPGDSSFINDEPMLIQRAFTANHQPGKLLGISLPFTPARLGLAGTRGASYGPLPIWSDQILLALTHNNLVAMVAIHALLFSTIVAIAMLWLARSMGLSPWFAALSMFSPWLWRYSRSLWDNNLLIPLAALAVAAYADFLLTHRKRSLTLAAICLAAMTLIHLMCLSLIAGMAVHFVIFHRMWLRRFLGPLLWVALFWALLFIPYLIAMYQHPEPPNYAEHESALQGWWHPLAGAQHLTAQHWLPRTRDYYPLLFRLCEKITFLAYLAPPLGMALVLFRFAKRSRGADFTPVDHLALMCFFVAVCQGLLDGVLRIELLPHYFNATWIVYVVLAWYAIDALRQSRFKPLLTVSLPVTAYVSAALVVLTMSIFFIHINAGTRTIDFGTVLEEQIRAAHQIAQFSPDSPLVVTNRQWTLYPEALNNLLAVQPPPAGGSPRRRITIRFLTENPHDAHLHVEVAPPVAFIGPIHRPHL